MALSERRVNAIREQYKLDSSEGIIMFTIDNATEEKIANRYTNSVLNHPKDFGNWSKGIYEGIAIWNDSAGEIQLSSDCTEVED